MQCRTLLRYFCNYESDVVKMYALFNNSLKLQLLQCGDNVADSQGCGMFAYNCIVCI